TAAVQDPQWVEVARWSEHLLLRCLSGWCGVPHREEEWHRRKMHLHAGRGAGGSATGDASTRPPSGPRACTSVASALVAEVRAPPAWLITLDGPSRESLQKPAKEPVERHNAMALDQS